MLSRYCSNSNLTHIKIITRVLRYVKDTLHYNIYYKDKESLIEYTNTNFAKVINDRRFIKEYIYFLLNNSIL